MAKTADLNDGGLVELFVFGRFHACAGYEGAVDEALHDVVGSSREEAGCLGIHAFRSTRDPQLFYIHRNSRGFASHRAIHRTNGAAD